MAQISDRSPRRGCKQTEGKQAVSLTRGGCKHFNTPEVHMNSGPGGKMAVAWPAPCPITAGMAHDRLGWNGVILKGSGGGSR